MDQIDRLVFDVVGRDRGGSKVLSDSSKHADAAHQSFSKLGSTLSGLDGPFGQVTSAAGTLGDAMQGTTGFATKLGLGLTAAGVGLIAFAAKDQQAQRQLRQSVENTGASYSDYQGQIEEAIKAQERNAHTADDTQNALNTLTTATQDTSKSLSEMGLVADVAAAKHENLAAAATQVVQAQSGSTRAFKSFGIVLDGTGTKTDQINRALKELQDRLSGQASASVDTFAGRLKVAETRLEDNIAALGKYGPEITAAGVALTVYAGALQLKAARTIADTAATEANTRAELANAEARARTGEAAAVEAGAIQRSTIAKVEGAGGIGMAGRLGRGGAFLLGGYLAQQVIPTVVPGTAGRYASDVGAGALYGAGIGTMVEPGLGTAVGAGVGAVVGLGAALLHHPAAPAGAKTVGQTEASYQKTLTTLHTLQAAAKTSTGLTHQAQEAAIKDAQAALKAGAANHQYATSLIHEASAANTATVSIDGQLAALNKSVTADLNLSDAEDGMRKAMHNAAQAAHDGGTALKGHTQAAIDNRDALRAVVKQEQDVLTAMRAHHASADKVRAAAIAMSRAIRHNATEIYGSKRSVDSLLTSLGVMPKQMSRSLTSFDGFAEKLNTWGANLASAAFDWGSTAGSNFDLGWNTATQDVFSNHAESLAQRGIYSDSTQKAAKKAGSQIGTVIVNGAAPVIDTGLADATQKALDKAKQKIEAERQQMHALLQQVTSANQNTKQSLIDAANIGSASQNADMLDSFGDSMGPGNILASKRQYVHQLVHFAHLLHRLRQAGYHSAIIDQVEALGVAGVPAAEELLAGGSKERRALNRVETRIERVSGRIAGEITAGDYGSEIIKELRRLPDALERKMIQALRHERIYVDTDALGRKRGREVRNRS